MSTTITAPEPYDNYAKPGQDPVRVARSRLANATMRYTPAGAEEIERWRATLHTAKLERAIQDALAAAPPLTDDQRIRLAALLTGGAK